MRTTVAQSIVDVLKQWNTENFFLLTGGDQPLWIALHDSGIRMVLGRSEAGSVYMADGYARASGKPGITYGQAGPGAANVAAALADSFWAQSPVVAITGATASSVAYQNDYQSIDQMPMFAPVTRWSGHATKPERVPSLLAIAIEQAMSGPRGPVHLDVPKDYFGLPIEAFSASAPATTTPAHPDAGGVDAIAAALRRARKPVILAGEGIARAGAEAALRALVDATGIPVVTTMGGKTTLSPDHPLNAGTVGRYAATVANAVAKEADCVLVVGSRLGGLATDGYAIPAPEATLLQVDIDPTVFGLVRAAEVNLMADARLALEALGRTPVAVECAAWTESVRARIADWRCALAALLAKPGNGNGLTPPQVLSVLAAHAADFTLVADTGYAAAWTGVMFPSPRPGSFFRAVGSLGWAVPASMGVQMARREKVVCLTGDGGLGYHLPEIETAARHKLPVVIVVLNNGCLAFEYHEQKYRHQGRVIPEANDFRDTDYAAVARGLGAHAERVDGLDGLKTAFAKALRHDGPVLLDVVADREPLPPVTNYDSSVQREV